MTSDAAERVLAYAASRGYYRHDQEQIVYNMYRPLQRRRQMISDVSTTRLAIAELHEYIEREYQALVRAVARENTDENSRSASSNY